MIFDFRSDKAAGGARRFPMAPIAVAVVASSALLLTGCSSSSHTAAPAGAGSSAAAAAPNTIVIKNFMFQPMSLTVSPSAKVTVTNDDSVAHTITASGNKAFDTGNVAPGKSVTFTAPTAAGTYAYICSIHQYMQGTLIVK